MSKPEHDMSSKETCDAIPYDEEVSGDLNERLDETLCEISKVTSIDPPPDGGFWAWMQVLGGFCCNFSAWGIVNSFGVFQEYYAQNLLQDKSPGQISWIGALCGLFAFTGAIFIGPLVDLSYHTYIVGVAGVIECFALMMLSISTEYYQIILAHGVLLGLAASALFLVSLSTVAPWFTTKRAIAMGLSSCGSAVGGTMYSSVTRKLLVDVGFAWTTRILGFIVLFTTGIMVLTIRPRLPPRRRGNLLAVECFREPLMMSYCLSTVSAFAGLYTFYFYYQSYALHEQPNTPSLVYVSAILNAGSIVGRLLPNYLSGRVGVFNCLFMTHLLSGVVAFCWIPTHSSAGLIVLALFYGMVSGPVMGLPGVVVSKLTPNMNSIGVRMSFSFVFNGLGLLFGAPFAGIMVRQHGYFYAKLYCALVWILAAAISFTGRMIASKGKLWAAV